MSETAVTPAKWSLDALAEIMGLLGTQLRLNKGEEGVRNAFYPLSTTRLALICEKHAAASGLTAGSAVPAPAPPIEKPVPPIAITGEEISRVAIQAVLATKNLRVKGLAEHFQTTEQAVLAIIETPGSGLAIARPGWVKIAA